MKASSLFEGLGVVFFGFLFLYWIFSWVGARDQEAFEFYTRYEQCVSDQYSTTPSAWFAEYGVYPECDPSKV